MFKNHLKVAFRNLVKYKYYSLINIAGLGVGIACCLLILHYVKHELSYDRYHAKADRIFRVVFAGSFGGSDLNFASVAAATAEALLRDYPEVMQVTRLYKLDPQRNRISYGDKTFVETRTAFADASLFDVFTIPLLSGSPATALAEPNTIVISEKMARKYFDKADPRGKTLTFDSTTDYRITGVFREIPANTHFHFDFIASLTTLAESRDPWWLNNMRFRTYIVLRENVDPHSLEAKFPDMIRKYCAPMLEQGSGQSFDQMTRDGLKLRYYLQPVTDIHLYSDLRHELEPNADIRYVYSFAAIALFILMMACINFMNLSTARSGNRSREVGIRKVLGSGRLQLVIQFLAESVIVTFFALVIAVFLTELALPFFGRLAGKELTPNYFSHTITVLSLLAIVILVGLLAGSYPAFALSSYKPVVVLKHKLNAVTGRRFVRSGLVVFQFTMSIALIVATAVVYTQLHYIQNRKLGFEKEQVLVVHDAYILQRDIEPFKNALRQNPEIMSATVTGYLPVTSERTEDVIGADGTYSEKGTAIQTWTVDFDYIKTMGMEIVAGRDFSSAFSTDSSAVIVNEAAVKHFGWIDPIGKHIADRRDDVLVRFPVIGVVRDFHYESLKDRIRPLALFIGSSNDLISLRLKTNELSQTIQWIADKWNQFAPGQPFEYTFLDDRFDAMYKTEQRIGNIFAIFAALAVFLGCLGLLGLAAFTAAQRTKEIGIRKILGSSTLGVVLLLTKEFSKWVFIAAIIACPVSYLAMNSWLQQFAYRTEIGITTFISAGLLTLVIAFLTVSYQAVKAAITNPVEAIRYE